MSEARFVQQLYAARRTHMGPGDPMREFDFTNALLDVRQRMSKMDYGFEKPIMEYGGTPIYSQSFQTLLLPKIYRGEGNKYWCFSQANELVTEMRKRFPNITTSLTLGYLVPYFNELDANGREPHGWMTIAPYPFTPNDREALDSVVVVDSTRKLIARLRDVDEEYIPVRSAAQSTLRSSPPDERVSMSEPAMVGFRQSGLYEFTTSREDGGFALHLYLTEAKPYSPSEALAIEGIEDQIVFIKTIRPLEELGIHGQKAVAREVTRITRTGRNTSIKTYSHRSEVDNVVTKLHQLVQRTKLVP